MDSAQLTMLASTLKSLPQDYFPYFDICHITLCVLSVRKEAGREFAWKHPVSAWISCVIASFAGSIICGPLLGKSDFFKKCKNLNYKFFKFEFQENLFWQH